MVTASTPTVIPTAAVALILFEWAEGDVEAAAGVADDNGLLDGLIVVGLLVWLAAADTVVG